MRRRIVSIIAPPPSRISNPVVPRTLSQQQASFADVTDIICIIFLDFFSNSDYSFIDLKSVIAFRALSKKIAEAIDERLGEIYPNYPQIIQMGADAHALFKILSMMKTQVNSSVIVSSGFSPYKINLPKLRVTGRHNDKNSLLTVALLTGSGSHDYAGLKKLFDDAFQNNELVLSCFFRNLKSLYEENSEFIHFVSACVFFICLGYHQLRFKVSIGLARECEIINDNYRCIDHKLISCDALRSVNNKTNTTLWGLSVQTLIDFCAQQESLCHLFTSSENFHHGNRTLTRECGIDDGLISFFLMLAGEVGAIILFVLAIIFIHHVLYEHRDECRTMMVNWLKKPLSEKLPVVWSEKTARNINSFFNPSLRTAVTVLDELPAQNTCNDKQRINTSLTKII